MQEIQDTIPMIKIHMIKDAYGYDDGKTIKLYKAGNQYDVSENLANNFCAMSVAEKAKEPHQNKAIDHIKHQNKSIRGLKE